MVEDIKATRREADHSNKERLFSSQLSARKQIEELIKTNDVVVLTGLTGVGKTTCLKGVDANVLDCDSREGERFIGGKSLADEEFDSEKPVVLISNPGSDEFASEGTPRVAIKTAPIEEIEGIVDDVAKEKDVSLSPEERRTISEYSLGIQCLFLC